MFQIFGQSRGRGIAALRIFLQALQANRGQVPIYLRVQKARSSRLGIQEEPEGFVSCSSSKRRMAGQKLVKHGTKSIHTCGAREFSSFTNRLFRGHVTR